jgi:hypothetical protein
MRCSISSRLGPPLCGSTFHFSSGAQSSPQTLHPSSRLCSVPFVIAASHVAQSIATTAEPEPEPEPDAEVELEAGTTADADAATGDEPGDEPTAESDAATGDEPETPPAA